MHRILRRSAAIALLACVVSLLLVSHVVTVAPTTVYAGSPNGPTPTASCSADGGVGCGVGSDTASPASSGGGGSSDCTWGAYPFPVILLGERHLTAGLDAYQPADAVPPVSPTPTPTPEPSEPAVPVGLSDAEASSYLAWTAANQAWRAGTPPYTTADILFCPDPDVVEVGFVGTGITPTAGNVLGLWAYSQVSWTPPSLGTSSPLTAAAVVNLPTFLFLNPGAYQATGTTATVPGGAVSATIVATPVKVVWSAGDGGSVTCPGQGVPYDSAWGNSPPPAGSGACTYTYSDTSADQPGGTYSLSATVWYHATWTSTGAGGAAGDLGLVAGPTVTEQITVDQIASVITSG